jgi:hypothetical protein
MEKLTSVLVALKDLVVCQKWRGYSVYFFTSADELELFCKSIKSTGNNKNNFMEPLY